MINTQNTHMMALYMFLTVLYIYIHTHTLTHTHTHTHNVYIYVCVFQVDGWSQAALQVFSRHHIDTTVQHPDHAFMLKMNEVILEAMVL